MAQQTRSPQSWPLTPGRSPSLRPRPEEEEQEGITESLEPDEALEAGAHAPHRVPRSWHFSPRPHGILNRQGPRGEAWGMGSDIPQLHSLKPSNRWGLVPGGRASSQVCTLTMPARAIA